MGFERKTNSMNMRADTDALLAPRVLVAERASNAVVITDVGNRITWANQAFGDFAGCEVAACLGRRPGAVLPFLRNDPDTRAPLLAAVNARQATRLRRLGRDVDGPGKWIDIDLQPLFGAAGAFDGYIAVITDVTELVAQREQAQGLLHSLPVGVVMVDLQLRVLQANESAARIYGVPLPQLLGQRTCQLFPDALYEDGQPMARELRPMALTVADGQDRHELCYGLRLGDGKRHWLRTSTVALHDADGGISGAICCFSDQTEARDQRRLLDLAVEAARIAPWHWNLVDDLVHFDARAADAVGLRFAARGSGRQSLPLWPAVHRDDVGRMREVLRQNQPGRDAMFRVELRLPSAQGGWRWMLAAGAPAEHDEQGKITAMSGVLIDIDERKQAEAALHRAATTDTLTGLPNRTLLGDRLLQALRSARRRSRFGALLYIDLDHFKRINDVYGHAVGDSVLRAVGQRLQQALRSEDTLARMGGDELMVLLPDLGNDSSLATAGAEHVGQKLLASLVRPFVVDGLEYTLGASIGCTLFPKSAQENVEDLVREADTAMYVAKAAGRGALKCYEHSMQRGVAERLALERDLRLALDNAEFSINLQGKWKLLPGATPASPPQQVLAGAEVLLRWKQPQRGFVSPADFIPVAEESLLILAIGRWVIDQACALQARWMAEGRSLPLAVNVSPRQFREPGFANDLLAITQRHGVDPGLLTLEITEGVLLDEGAAERLQQIAALGFRFSIDDFGTGYSSLMYLKKLPVHELKIDRAFVRDLTTDPEDAAIVLAMLAIARRFRMEVVAEGVETAEQAEFLRRHDCDLMQGYLLGRPQPVAIFEAGLAPKLAA